MRRISSILFAFTCGAVWCQGIANSSAATFPYLETFDDEVLGATAPSEPAPESGIFSVVTAGHWSVQAGSLDGDLGGKSFRNAFTADNTPSLALIDFAGSLGGAVSSASDFVVSTDLRFNDGTAATGALATAGIGFLMTSGGTGYFVDVATSGLLRIIEGGTVVASIDQGTVDLNVPYRMTLSGTYVDTNADLVKDQLNISVSISGQGMDSTPLTFSDSTAVSTATHFGFRNRNNASDINASFDNFSVVPEPGAAVLLLAGAGITVRRRRAFERR